MTERIQVTSFCDSNQQHNISVCRASYNLLLSSEDKNKLTQYEQNKRRSETKKFFRQTFRVMLNYDQTDRVFVEISYFLNLFFLSNILPFYSAIVVRKWTKWNFWMIPYGNHLMEEIFWYLNIIFKTTCFCVKKNII